MAPGGRLVLVRGGTYSTRSYGNCDCTETADFGGNIVYMDHRVHYTETRSRGMDFASFFQKELDRLAKIAWLRWSWDFVEYRPRIKKVFLQTRLIHRKMCFSLSGWLGRNGKKKRDGK
jgi:hypothetical protein